MHRFSTWLVLSLALLHRADAVPLKPPPFLPDYYSEAFATLDRSWRLVEQSATNGQFNLTYESKPCHGTLVLEHIPCDRTTAPMHFNDIARRLNQRSSRQQGRFDEVSEFELRAGRNKFRHIQSIWSFMLPRSIQIWTWTFPRTAPEVSPGTLQVVRQCVNRQRYEDARRGGNVAMGRWDLCIRAHALDLLNDGDQAQALKVLHDLLSTSPNDFETHLAYMASAADPAAASNSAQIVFRNSEDPAHMERAAAILGIPKPNYESLPPVSPDDTGLRLVLIPLEPDSLWFLDDAVKLYEQITDIPVSIRRLEEPWEWKTPERIARQREVQRLLHVEGQPPIDFTGWSPKRYAETFRANVETADAFSRWQVEKLIAAITSAPGQYEVAPHLKRLKEHLKEKRSADWRTMYVALTRTNIYSGDSNFIFSMASCPPAETAAFLSYYMMLSSTLDESPASRARLTERIAKSLVAASIWQLDIPRSTDPACPTSYPDGVSRLDQQALVLSADIRSQLEKVRDSAGAPPAGAPP